METARISKSFFRKEILNYANPWEDFIRELYQNSIDAGSKNIKISLHEINDKETYVVFQDDGCGMTEEVLRNVYFHIGETTKDIGDYVGGFGKARILTTFAHEEYNIKTQDNIVSGSYAEFEISKSSEYFSGTFLKIKISENIIKLLNNFQIYFNACNTEKINLEIDGVAHVNYPRKLKLIDELEFAKVYVDEKNKEFSECFTRVNGIQMYSEFLPSNAKNDIIIEIDKDKSKEVFLSNRNSIKYDYKKQINDLMSEIAINPLSSIKGRAFKYNVVYGKYRTIGEIIKNDDDYSDNYHCSDNEDLNKTNSNITEKRHDHSVAKNNKIKSKTEYQEEIMKINMMIQNESISECIYNSSKDFDPKNWISLNNHKYKLFLMWDSFVEDILKITCKMYPNFIINFHTGFIFTDDKDKLAVNYQKNGVFHILLNPISEFGYQKYRISDNLNVSQLISLAIHEVCHCLTIYHDEIFSSYMTALNGFVLNNVKILRQNARKRIKEKTL